MGQNMGYPRQPGAAARTVEAEKVEAETENAETENAETENRPDDNEPAKTETYEAPPETAYDPATGTATPDDAPASEPGIGEQVGTRLATDGAQTDKRQ